MGQAAWHTMVTLRRCSTELVLKLCIVLCVILSGCASNPNTTQTSATGHYETTPDQPSVVSYDDFNDPLEWLNRPIFAFNNVLYRYALSPAAKGYHAVVPDPVENSIGNFFSNLKEPLTSLNKIFQGKPKQSGKSLLRFTINSTLGLLGFFDTANAWWGIEEDKATLADTLAYHGVGYGAYIVLPILGPSDLRDTTSLTFEYFAHPINQMNDKQSATAIRAYDGFHDKSYYLSRYPDLVEKNRDNYIFIRNFYLQGIERDSDNNRKEGSAPYEKAP